jgi:hypothetical protein
MQKWLARPIAGTAAIPAVVPHDSAR